MWIHSFLVARNFLCRAIAGQSVEGIMATLSSPCTSGFSLNVGRLSDMTVLNIEISPDGIWTTPINEYGYHFNMFVVLLSIGIESLVLPGTFIVMSHNMVTPALSTVWPGSRSSKHPHAARMSSVS